LTTILLLSALTTTVLPFPLPEDVRLLACAVQTEAYPLRAHRNEAGAWVAHVALNRAATGWWGTLAETLVRDFHGVPGCGQPDPWATWVAVDAMVEDDPTGGMLFVLSTADLDKLGWIEPGRSFGDDPGLHFYREWFWE
jgi:hypothetical protein